MCPAISALVYGFTEYLRTCVAYAFTKFLQLVGASDQRHVLLGMVQLRSY